MKLINTTSLTQNRVTSLFLYRHKNKRTLLLVPCFFSLLLSLTLVFASAPRKSTATGRQVQSSKDESTSGEFASSCGTKDEVARRSADCMDPIFDLVEGRGYGEPKSDTDLVEQCEKFAVNEKCIRKTARDCLKGIHKAAAGAMATSSHNFRTRECKTPTTRAKYLEPLKCTLKRGPKTSELHYNITALAYEIYKLPLAAEERVMRMCCLLLHMEKLETEAFEQTCPQSVDVILSIMHAMTDDARTTLCRNPKCTNVLEQLHPKPLPRDANGKLKHNIIEPIMKVVLDL